MMKMPDKIKFFTADYRDKYVYIKGKKFLMGSFAVDFLNQYEENDNGARIVSMRYDNLILSSQMEKGYINDYDFVKAGKEILNILDVLPCISPFQYLDIEAEKKLIAETFTKETANYILEYYQQRAKVSLQDKGAMSLDILPERYAELSKEANKLLARVKILLQFYENIGNDMIKAFEKLTEFVWGLEDLSEHYDENELIAHAYEIFGIDRFSTATEYAAITKGKKKLIVKRVHFRNFYSFILTEFFEGLSFGHYPRQCEVCETYFLMENLRKQKYCTGFAPLELTEGKELTCRQYAAMVGRKELAENDPVKDIYTKRCACIRSEASRGKISEDFAEVAKELAKELKTRYDYDKKYTFKEYQKDMERDNLYQEVNNRIKKE